MANDKNNSKAITLSSVLFTVLICLTFPFSAFFFLFMGFYEYALNTFFKPCWDALEKCLCSNKKSEALKPDDYCEIPSVGKNGPEVLPVPIFYLETADWKALRQQYYRHCLPFVLRHKDGKPFSLVEPTPKDGNVSPPRGRYAYGDSKAAKLSGLRKIASRFVKVLIYSGEHWLLGNYMSSRAHIDGSLGDRTFYFMRTGSKDIVIVPREPTKKLKIPVGVDTLALPNTRRSQEWMKDLECPYYRMILPEQSILVFSGSACLHQFTNIEAEEMPRALLVRIKDAWGADTRVSWNIAFNPKFWWNVHNQIWCFLSGTFYEDISNTEDPEQDETMKEESAPDCPVEDA